MNIEKKDVFYVYNKWRQAWDQVSPRKGILVTIGNEKTLYEEEGNFKTSFHFISDNKKECFDYIKKQIEILETKERIIKESKIFINEFEEKVRALLDQYGYSLHVNSGDEYDSATLEIWNKEYDYFLTNSSLIY